MKGLESLNTWFNEIKHTFKFLLYFELSTKYVIY